MTAQYSRLRHPSLALTHVCFSGRVRGGWGWYVSMCLSSMRALCAGPAACIVWHSRTVFLEWAPRVIVCNAIFTLGYRSDACACCKRYNCGGGPLFKWWQTYADSCWGVRRQCPTDAVSCLCCESHKMRESRESRKSRVRPCISVECSLGPLQYVMGWALGGDG